MAVNENLSPEERISAVLYLGNYKHKQSVEVLIQCISFRNSSSAFETPAHLALAQIGDYAFNQIFNALKDAVRNNASKETQSDLVIGLIYAKGEKEFVSWYKQNKKNMDEKLLTALTSYSVQF
jgi:hypothetical protein